MKYAFPLSQQDGSARIVTGVRVEREGLSEVRCDEDRILRQESLQLIEGLLAVFTPLMFAGKTGEVG